MHSAVIRRCKEDCVTRSRKPQRLSMLSKSSTHFLTSMLWSERLYAYWLQFQESRVWQVGIPLFLCRDPLSTDVAKLMKTCCELQATYPRCFRRMTFDDIPQHSKEYNDIYSNPSHQPKCRNMGPRCEGVPSRALARW